MKKKKVNKLPILLYIGFYIQKVKLIGKSIKSQIKHDKNGNITQIYENGTLAHKYTYDSLNQLKDVYDYINNFYINYSYDLAENLHAKNEQYLDPTYGYPTGSLTGNVYEYTDTEWKDKVTKINGDTITYDESGNPLSYRNDMTMTWEHVRHLSSLQTADNSVSYKYDSNGMRTQKTNNSGTTYYYYDSNNNLIGLTKGNNTLLFYYDSDGNVTSFKYDNAMYYYVKNFQGDVVKIINQSGTVCASYVYDAWGNIRSATCDEDIVSLNPFRYRGYVYDEESELYYLQSRYYDPFTGRFINADVYCDTGNSIISTNMFAYCENNAVMKYDITGKDAWWLQDTGAVYGLGHTSLLIQQYPGKWWYFYWGNKSIQLIYIGTCTLESLNDKLHKMGLYDKNHSYNKVLKFKGDFKNSLTYILKKMNRSSGLLRKKGNIIVNGNKSYFVLYNNCVQVSIEALMAGKFSKSNFWVQSQLLRIRYDRYIPNQIYWELVARGFGFLY